MLVKKRNGEKQEVDFEKIHWRIKSICSNKEILEFQKKERLDAYNVFSKLPVLNVKKEDIDMITKKTIDGLYNGITTTEIDMLSAEIAQEMGTDNPDNSVLATRLLVSNMQKNILEILKKRFPDVDKEEIHDNLFKYVMTALYYNRDQNGELAPLVAPYMLGIAHKYSEKVNSILDFSRDFTNNNFLGIKTLEQGYLFKVHSMENFKEKNITLETPGIAEMRVAIALMCSPAPCPPTFPPQTVREFIYKNPQLLKKKAFDASGEIKPHVYVELTSSEEPHKNRYVNTKLFKEKYWDYMAKKNIEEVEVDDETWRQIADIYDGMSRGLFTPATPTRFSLGSLKPQGSSCFLLAMQDDSLKGIYDTLSEQSQISKHSGGVGIWCSNIRACDSYIAGTNGKSNGLKVMLKVFDASSDYVNQSGRRPGSISIYVEPWHADILDFIQMKRKKGAEKDRARSLFYALWIPDEFFRCWKSGNDWYLFDPVIVPKLYDCYDEEFSSNYLSDEFLQQPGNKEKYLFTYRYRKYIRQGKFVKKISCEKLMEEVVETVKESGVPYMLCKDACNRKSNQKNIGVIKSSNLCTEIIQYSDKNTTAVCNLSSICLNKFLRPFKEGDNPDFKYNISLRDGEEDFWTFDFEEFGRITRIVQRNIDRLIDLNYYPTQNAERSNFSTRDCGAGVQGEADVFAKLRLPWNSKEALRLRFYIYEKMYYESLKSSCDLSKQHGPYKHFDGSPASQGLLQFDLWKKEGKKISFPLSLDWDGLKRDIKTHGLRNALTVTMMPTASTSQIMGNSPAIEPINSLVYVRKSNAGDVAIFNKELICDLRSLGLWDKNMRDRIMANHGSIKNFLDIPRKLRDSYLTVYDLEPEDIIDSAFTRGWFVDQSQSMNLFISNVTMSSLSKAWMRGWLRGLKTLSYYIRSRSATTSQKAQISVKEVKKDENIDGPVCSRDNPNCLSCGS